jgi:hypothetical protein
MAARDCEDEGGHPLAGVVYQKWHMIAPPYAAIDIWPGQTQDDLHALAGNQRWVTDEPWMGQRFAHNIKLKWRRLGTRCGDCGSCNRVASRAGIRQNWPDERARARQRFHGWNGENTFPISGRWNGSPWRWDRRHSNWPSATGGVDLLVRVGERASETDGFGLVDDGDGLDDLGLELRHIALSPASRDVQENRVIAMDLAAVDGLLQ